MSPRIHMATAGALVLALAAACGGGGDDMEANCPADEPASCPATGVPSYATDVAPLIAKYCTISACHSPEGSAGDRLMSTYPELKQLLGDAHSELYQCEMPLMPPDPSLAERVTLLTWFVCGGPNN